MKKILVPTDFSENAHNAFRFALHIASKYNAIITTIHIAEPVSTRGEYTPETFLQKMESEMEKEFEKYQKEAELLRQSAEYEMLTQVQVNHILKDGKVIPEILKVINEQNYDFVVMGTKGASNLGKVMFGSNTTKLMEKSNCPVLVVPDGAQYKGVGKVAYAMEAQWEEDFAIDVGLEWAKYFNGQLTCFTIENQISHNWDVMDARVQDKQYEFRNQPNIKFELIDGHNVYFEIHNFVKLRKPDLLIMVYRKLGIIEKLFFDRKVRDVALGIDIPLLILKEQYQ